MKFLNLYVLAITACVFASALAEAKDLKLMQYGAWGLSMHKDPFKNKYPVVSYLPPGTILFETKPSPLRGYMKNGVRSSVVAFIP